MLLGTELVRGKLADPPQGSEHKSVQDCEIKDISLGLILSRSSCHESQSQFFGL